MILDIVHGSHILLFFYFIDENVSFLTKPFLVHRQSTSKGYAWLRKLPQHYCKTFPLLYSFPGATKIKIKCRILHCTCKNRTIITIANCSLSRCNMVLLGNAFPSAHEVLNLLIIFITDSYMIWYKANLPYTDIRKNRCQSSFRGYVLELLTRKYTCIKFWMLLVSIWSLSELDYELIRGNTSSFLHSVHYAHLKNLWRFKFKELISSHA